ncbi:MAG: Asp23/Gls24 family envelope stress response protein [Clostridia bacterium]|nr:Asp23/Gls24 family envelope stress response protein [Clostridia bacterium]
MPNDVINDGNIEVSENVIITFVEKVVAEIKGISLSKRKKSIKVTNTENGKKIELSLEVNYGVIIPEVVRKLQTLVKENIKLMTGLSISEVNVVVDSLNIDSLLGK